MTSPGRADKLKSKHKSVADNQKQNSGRTGRKKNQPEPKTTLIEQLDRFIKPRMTLVFYVSLFFSLFFGAFLFDVKVSTGGDDSSYIEMANNYINGIAFPTFHGPLYSIFLSLPILIFGVNVVMLKLFSYAFIIGHLIIFYHTFKSHISPFVFSLIMLIISANSTILYFASQTYSEAMYMFLQSLIIFLFINLFLALDDKEFSSSKRQVKHWVIIGFFALIISLTREIGIVILLSMVLFLIVQRRYLAGFITTVSFFLFLIPYKIYKTLVWDSSSTTRTSNLSEMLLKDHYNRAEGYEDFGGMIVRFFENARLYLSKHFMIGIGLHDPSSTDKSWFVTLIVIGLFLVALMLSLKRNRTMLFLSIYLIASLAATFIALQTSWDQMRMVVIYIPMMLVLISWGILQLSNRKGYGLVQVVLVGLLVLIFFRTLGQTIDKMKENRPVLAENIRGNMYYGFTPDWQNYLMMSEWVGENLPDSVKVASRKPSMSFIYSKGKDFYGIYRLPVEVSGTMIEETKSNSQDVLVAVSHAELQNLSRELQMQFKSNALIFIALGNDLYSICNNNNQFRDLMTLFTEQDQINAMTTDSLLEVIQNSDQQSYAVSPDSLLLELKQNNVGFVIMANLRAVPNAKTGRTINTVQRYLYFIEQKYPGIFILEHQIGGNDDEPAWLYRVNYDLYRI